MTMNAIGKFSMRLLACMALALPLQLPAAQGGSGDRELSREIRAAAMAIAEYSVDRRDEAVRRAKSALDDVDARIEVLQARIERDAHLVNDAAHANAKKTLRALRQQRNEAAEWYGALKHSSQEAWSEVRSGFVRSYEILANSFSRAAEKL